MFWLTVILFVCQFWFSDAALGSCKQLPDFIRDFNGPTFPIDIDVDPVSVENIRKNYIIDELVVVKDFTFDLHKINYIAAIELTHEVNCVGECSETEITKNRKPWKCNKYVFDASLIGFYQKPDNFNESVTKVLRDEISRSEPYIRHHEFGNANGSVILARFNPADRFISFRTPFDKDYHNGYLKTGSKTQSPFKFGRIVVRFAFVDEFHDFEKNKTHFTTIPVKMRFHSLIPDRNDCLTQSGLTTFANFETKGRIESYLHFSNGPQSVSNIVSQKTLSSLLTLNKANVLDVMGLSVIGFNWMLSYNVEFLFNNEVIFSISEDNANYWDLQSLLPLSEPVFVTNQTSIYFTCNYDSTKHPFINVPKTTLKMHKIPIGPNPQYAPCILQLQFSNANCANQVVYDKDWIMAPCSNITTSTEHRCK